MDYPISSGRSFEEILRVLDSLQLTSTYQCATPVDWKKGSEVVVSPVLTDEKANEVFPQGFKKLTPYLRITPDPSLLMLSSSFYTMKDMDDYLIHNQEISDAAQLDLTPTKFSPSYSPSPSPTTPRTLFGRKSDDPKEKERKKQEREQLKKERELMKQQQKWEKRKRKN